MLLSSEVYGIVLSTYSSLLYFLNKDWDGRSTTVSGLRVKYDFLSHNTKKKKSNQQHLSLFVSVNTTGDEITFYAKYNSQSRLSPLCIVPMPARWSVGPLNVKASQFRYIAKSAKLRFINLCFNADFFGTLVYLI